MRGAMLLALLGTLTVGCKKPTFLGAARVEVKLEPGAGIACVEVIAQSLDTGVLITGTSAVNGRALLHVGISETATFSGRVRVTVRGFSTPNCTMDPLVTLPPQEVTLGPPPFDEAVVFLFRAMGRDGGVADAGFDAGLSDGDAGSGCSSASCFARGDCDTARCLDDGGCLRENRPTMTFCDGGVCNDVGACVPPSPCPSGMSCSPGLSCTTSGLCSDGGVCVPSFAGCFVPLCHRSRNACLMDGGCDVEIDPNAIGTTCGAGNVCYVNGECQPQLRAANVQPTRAPWPSVAMRFDDLLTDGGVCNFIYQTSTDDGGFGPYAPASCAWPTTLVPVVLSQVGTPGPEVLVFSATELTINPGARVFFAGKRPVALLVHGDAQVQGQLFARPFTARLPGPGADSAWCDGGIGRAGVGEREGGGGGGYFELGGAGGRIGNHNGGVANGNIEIVPLRGGCSGGPGWGAPNDTPGLGGGALQLTVRGRLEIFDGGVITASGLGGVGGDGGTAAAGGGSGGAILLQAAEVVLLRGALTANGGGGGEGGTRTNSTSADGNPGGHGALVTATPAPGGSNGNCCGGNGGPGGAGVVGPDGGTNGINNGGNTPAGGGGGGSRGRIRIDTGLNGSCTLTSSVVSPDLNLEGPNTTCARN